MKAQSYQENNLMHINSSFIQKLFKAFVVAVMQN
jgi:hypothetical protein